MYRIYINCDGLRITLPESIWVEIQAAVKRCYPNEIGGVFTGRIDTANGIATIEQMLKPSKISSTPVFFKRFAKNINKLLLQLFDKSKGASYYLGEWHSHPDGFPNPSQTDITTMSKISNNENISISTPLLLIVGYNKDVFNEQFFIFSNNRLINYERQQD